MEIKVSKDARKSCDNCLHGRLIVSENGYHSACCMSQKAATKCLTGENDQFVAVEYVERRGD